MLERIKWIGITIVIALVVVIIVLNRDTAQFDLLFTTISMPRAAMMFGTLAVGYLAGMVVGNPLRFLRRKSS